MMREQKRSYSLFPKQLSQEAGKSLAYIVRQRGFNHPAILDYWTQAVGDAVLAQHCFPVKITKQKNAAYSVLMVKVHPAYATIFAHHADSILQRLTVLIGHRPAQRIVIIH